jgi:type II secretory pathway pseudopilin PulG
MIRPAPEPRSAPRVPFALLLVTLVIGGMCALLLLNTASAANQVRRHDLAVTDAAVAAQVQQLRNQVAASAAPGALGSAAAELGMVPAGNPAFLEIGPDGTVHVLGRPAAATAQVAPPPAPTHPPPTVSKPAAAKSSAGTHPAKTTPVHAGNPHGGAAASTTPTPTPTPTPTTTLGGTR